MVSKEGLKRLLDIHQRIREEFDLGPEANVPEAYNNWLDEEDIQGKDVYGMHDEALAKETVDRFIDECDKSDFKPE